jgi:hypothetical protein
MTPREKALARDAYVTALAIVADLMGRRGLKHAWQEIDQDVRDEIVQTWSEIISGHGAGGK